MDTQITFNSNKQATDSGLFLNGEAVDLFLGMLSTGDRR